MQSALHLRTTIQPGGKIEVADKQLPSGANVDVIVLLPPVPSQARRSAVDVLAEAPGQRIFKTAAEVDAYIQEERDSRDR